MTRPSPNAIQLDILSRMAEGKSLCFSRDGEQIWLSGEALSPLPAEYEPHIHQMFDERWLTYSEDEESRLDPYIWVITPTGRDVLKEHGHGG